MKVLKLNNAVAYWAMILLFPGYILYHGLLAFSLIPDFLSGLYGVVNIFTGLIFILLYFKNYKFNLYSKYSLFVILFIGFIFVWTVQYYLFSNKYYINATSIQSLQLVFLLFTMFFVGYYINIHSNNLYKVYYFSYILLLLLVIYFVQLTGSLFLSIERYFVVDNEISSYQGIARGGLIMLFVLISFSKSKWNLVFIISSGIFVLFIVGARSEFYGFVLAVLFFGLIKMKYSPKLTLSISLFFLIGFLYAIGNIEVFSSSRQLGVTELSSDKSWLMRQELRINAIDTITNNIIIGDFGSHATFGSVAHYSHDVLSVWVNYGIIGFLGYLSLITWAMISSGYHIFKSNFHNSYWNLSFLINFVVFLLVFTSKSAFWEIPALGWGIFLAAKMNTTK